LIDSVTEHINQIRRDLLGVPRRQPDRRSGLATLPSVGAVP